MKRYRDWRRWLSVLLLSLILPCSLLILMLSIWALIDNSIDLFTKFEAIGCLVLGIGMIVLCFKVLIPIMTGVFEIDQNIIRYRRAFKKDIVLHTKECTYVGVRTIRYSDQSSPFVLKGFQSSFIYLSEKPLDAKGFSLKGTKSDQWVIAGTGQAENPIINTMVGFSYFKFQTQDFNYGVSKQPLPLFQFFQSFFNLLWYNGVQVEVSK